MRCIILFRLNGDVYLFSDSQGRVPVYEQLWIAHQDFLRQYEYVVGQPFQYHEGIDPKLVPIRPSLIPVTCADEVRQLASKSARLLEIGGEHGQLYGVTANRKAIQIWEQGRKDKFKWLDMEISRQQKQRGRRNNLAHQRSRQGRVCKSRKAHQTGRCKNRAA